MIFARSRDLLRRIPGVALGVATAMHMVKAVPVDVSQMTWPYWAISYRHGFVRRALLGTLFRAFAVGISLDEQRHVVFGMHCVLTVLLAMGIVGWTVELRRGGAPDRRFLVLAGTVAVSLSFLFPTLGATAGYFDVYVVALALGGAFLAWRGRTLAAGVLGAFGPLVHDEFLFLWLPIVLCTAADIIRSAPRRRIMIGALPILLPVAAEFAVLVFHSSSAMGRTLEELPAEWRNIAVFQIGFADALRRMLSTMVQLPDHAVLAALMYLPPTIVTVACAATLGPRSTPPVVRWALNLFVALSPCSILFVAWDLSRFLVWSSFGAFVALAWAARHPEDTQPLKVVHRSGVYGSLGALAVCAAGGPFLYSYFDYTYADYNFGPSILRSTPAAFISNAWLRAYNSRSMTSQYDSRTGCTLEAHGSTKRGDDCALVVESGFVESAALSLSQGAYTARINVSPVGTCLQAAGELAVHLRWRFAPEKPSTRFDARAERTSFVDFAISSEEAAMGRVRVDVTRHAGCFRLASVEVIRR